MDNTFIMVYKYKTEDPGNEQSINRVRLVNILQLGLLNLL